MEEMSYTAGDYVVYPVYGVGKISHIDQRGDKAAPQEVYRINFLRDRMVLTLPVAKAMQSGLRGLSTPDTIEQALKKLAKKGRARSCNWTKRAQEYTDKVMSGDPIALAEVIRDLHPLDDAQEQSYSERKMYHEAVDRLAGELALIQDTDTAAAIDFIKRNLSTR
ncbi:MAG: CarD family transcriptional regulator [Pseudomonadota bacterium]